MKKLSTICVALLFSLVAFSQAEKPTKAEEKAIKATIDSIEKSFKYEHGTISLKDDVVKINVPEGFKYLNIEQAKKVLVDMFGNPDGEDITLGLLLPEKQGVLDEDGYIFNITYDEIGYVKDDDADKIDYTELLADMQKDATEANADRKKEGYPSINIVGWAATPFYDKEKKILHWAKEIKFEDSEENTLNYNIRILGRKGVLVLNAVSTIGVLPIVKQDMGKVMDIVQFGEGNKYSNFDPSVDKVAAVTIGGLVAGKILAKAGLWAVILKFGKVIAVGAFALVGGLWRKITGRRKEEDEEVA